MNFINQIFKSGAPNINLKIANRGKEIKEVEQSKATKIHLWINFISQLTRRIEVACESKIEVIDHSANFKSRRSILASESLFVIVFLANDMHE